MKSDARSTPLINMGQRMRFSDNYRIGELLKLRLGYASVQCHQSLCYWHTQSIEIDEGSD